MIPTQQTAERSAAEPSEAEANAGTLKSERERPEEHPIAKAEPKEKSSPAVSQPDCDLLLGRKMIARWLGLSLAQARQLIDAGLLPVHKVPGRITVFALKTELNLAFLRWAERR